MRPRAKTMTVSGGEAAVAGIGSMPERATRAERGESRSSQASS
jgi:hypothetical protein